MSATAERTRAGVLPATSQNVSVGAGWAALIFPQLVGLGFGTFSGLLDGSSVSIEGTGALALVYLFTAVGSAVPGLMAIIFVGVPLSLVASRLTRSSSSIATNITAQFIAGTVAGLIVVGLFVALEIGSVTVAAGGLSALPPIVAAGISAALGWRIALASARRASRKAHSSVVETMAEDDAVTGA